MLDRRGLIAAVSVIVVEWVGLADEVGDTVGVDVVGGLLTVLEVVSVSAAVKGYMD